MSITRLWAIGSVFIMVIAVAATWFLGVSPQIAAMDDAHTQLQGAKQQNAVNQAALDRLISESKHMSDYTSALTALRASVPDMADADDFISEIDGAVKENQVALASMTFSQAAYYVPPKAGGSGSSSSGSGSSSSGSDSAGSDSSASDTSSSSSASSAGSSATRVKGYESAPAAPATDPAVTGSNLVSIPVSLSVAGTKKDVLSFIGDMQRGSRLFLVNKVNSTITNDSAQKGATGSGDEPIMQATISGYIYVLLRDGSDGTLTSVNAVIAAQSGKADDATDAQTTGDSTK